MAPFSRESPHKGLLVRPRLNQLIEDGLQTSVVMLLAGPGYGKTQAMNDYLKTCRARTFWLRLGKLDNLTSYFWGHLLRTLQQQGNPALAEELQSLGFPDSLPKYDAFIQVLSASVTEKTVWIFDDFGTILSESVQEFFDMLSSLEVPLFSIVLLTSNMADVNYLTYISSSMAIITSDDLRFTRDEISALYALNGITLNSKTLRRLEKHTEGWALALHLLAQKQKGASAIQIDDDMSDDVIASIFEKRYFTPYAPSQKKLLLQLSLLDFFTRDFAVQLAKGKEKEITPFRGNPFIISEHATGRYFFHHMYRTFLKTKMEALTPQEIRQTWCEAADYYENAGDFIGAVRCCGKSGDHVRMLEIIRSFIKQQHGTHVHSITQENASFFMEHLDLLSPQEVQENPVADYFRALVYISTLQLDKAEALFQQLLQRLQNSGVSQNRVPMGDVYAALGSLHIMRYQDDFGAYFKKASELLPEGAALLNKRGLFRQNNSSFYIPDTQPGAVERTERMIHEGVPWVNRVLGGAMSGLEHLFSAEAAYLRCRPEIARQHALRAIYKAEATAQHDLVCNGYFLLMKLSMITGDLPEMTKNRQAIEDYAQRYNIGPLKEIEDTAVSWYYLGMHDFDKVPRSITQLSYTNLAQIPYNRAMQVHALYLYLTREAAKLVSMLELPVGQFTTHGVWQDRIVRCILQALAHMELKNHEVAVDCAWKAYNMSYHNSLHAPFLEAERGMHKLLKLLKAQDKYSFDPTWIAFIDEEAATHIKHMDAARAAYHAQQHAAKPAKDNPLTRREQETLQAIARGLTREEIAVAQYVSVNTVKSTIRNIYNKLDANNKADAVSIAITKGFIQGHTLQ